MDSVDPDDLYDERSGVSYARPILQGDVFERVVVPGLGDDPVTVQVVMHPCSMRRGTAMVERVQVAPVQKYQKVSDWDGHTRVMPLPELREDGTHYAAKFVDTTAAPASALTLDKRIASLSHRGILVLQQRIVKDHARLDLDLSLFREQSAPVLAEAEMQESWIEIALGDRGVLDLASVATATAQFQEWLDANDHKRRRELDNETNHAGLRRAVREEAQSRASSGGS